MVVVAPACRLARFTKPTGVFASATDCVKDARGRPEPFIQSIFAAGFPRPDGDGQKGCGFGDGIRAGSRKPIPAPTGHLTRLPYPPGADVPRTDGGKGAGGRRGLAKVIVPPACHVARLTYAARVLEPGADRGKDAGGRGGLAGGIIAPAFHFARLAYAACVVAPGADQGEDARGRHGLAVAGLFGAAGPGHAGATVGTRGSGPVHFWEWAGGRCPAGRSVEERGHGARRWTVCWV